MDESYSHTSIEVRTKTVKVSPRKITFVIRQICDLLRIDSYELNVIFMSKSQIAKINGKHRGKDKATDVLSFPLLEWKKPLPVLKKTSARKWLLGPALTPHLVLGDIFICPQVAQENATQIGQSLSEEIVFLLVHGILHLCGHDHMQEKDEKIMISAQKTIVKHLHAPTTHKLWQPCLSFVKGRVS